MHPSIRRLAIVATGITSLATSAAAQNPISFSDAIGIALRQNTTLKQAENAATLSNAAVNVKKQAFLPSLSLSSSSAQSIGRTFSQSEGTVLTQTAQSVNVGLSSSLTLFDGMRNLNELREAKLELTASTSDYARAKQTTVYAVANDFLSLMTANAQLAVQRENLATQQAQESQIDKFVKAGAKPISELYTQQATTASAQSSVVAAERTVSLAKIELIQTLQLDPRQDYEFTTPNVPEVQLTAQRFALDSLLSKAFNSRTDLTASLTRVDAAGLGVKAAGASRLPTVSLSTGYSTAFNSATSLSLADQLDQRRGGSISIGVSLPLFDRGATGVAEQQARVQQDNARLSLENQRQIIGLEVRRAYLDYESTRQQLTAAVAQQKAADLAVSTTQQRYQIGSATLLELTQARASGVQAGMAVASARYTLAFQSALMSYYTGDLDPSRSLFAE